MAKAFRDLVVWQRSVALATSVYRLTDEFPKTEMYGLSSQMRRAAVSIASNIAEGSARSTRRDFRQFVCVARGSNYELQTQLLIAQNMQLGPQEMIEGLQAELEEISKMLSGLEEFLLKPRTPKLTTDN